MGYRWKTCGLDVFLNFFVFRDQSLGPDDRPTTPSESKCHQLQGVPLPNIPDTFAYTHVSLMVQELERSLIRFWNNLNLVNRPCPPWILRRHSLISVPKQLCTPSSSSVTPVLTICLLPTLFGTFSHLGDSMDLYILCLYHIGLRLYWNNGFQAARMKARIKSPRPSKSHGKS